MDDVLKWLLNYCYDHGIGIIYTNKLPTDAPSNAFCNPKLVIFNDNYKNESEKPFMLAHEIGHVIDGNSDYYHLSHLGMARGEYSANVFAINLLSCYCLDNDIYFESVFEFAEAFGIPKSKYYLLDDLSAMTLNRIEIGGAK